ncbi:MAG: hypothetical protein ACEQSK_14810 [Sphingomonadaceae bacterium]
MRTTTPLALLAALMLLAGCQTMTPQPAADEPAPPPNPAFAAEMNKFNAQFPNDKATRYEDVSINYNNNLKLDEKGNCHALSRHPVIIILLLDAQGKVTSTTADVQNTKADCFRQAYASAQFPPPPFAPYRKPIKLK